LDLSQSLRQQHAQDQYRTSGSRQRSRQRECEGNEQSDARWPRHDQRRLDSPGQCAVRIGVASARHYARRSWRQSCRAFACCIRITRSERSLNPSALCVIAAVAAGMALSGCATGITVTEGADAAPVAAASVAQRDLMAPEKKAIVDAVAPSLRNAGAAKYRWA